MKLCLVAKLDNGNSYAAQFEADITWLPLDAKDSVVTEAIPLQLIDVTMDNGRQIFWQWIAPPKGSFRETPDQAASDVTPAM